MNDRARVSAAPHCLKYLGAALLLCGATQAQATEGGGSSWPMGIENYLMGAIPAPGFYSQVFVGNYLASTLRGNDGRKLPVDLDLRVTTVVPRFIWVSEQQWLGASPGFHALLPLNDMRISVNGAHDHKRGIGDAHLGPFLGFHHSERLHTALGVDFVLPTGAEYDKDDAINLGNHYSTVQAVYAVSYIDPQGLNADIRLMHEYNFENTATDYQSGRELHADYALGWGVDDWVLGVGGYAYRQISDDRVDGRRLADNRGRSFAIGPSVQYRNAAGWSLSAKWQGESGVRNRAEGQAYWLKLTVPL